MTTIKEIIKYFKERGFKTVDVGVDHEQVIKAPKNILESKKEHITFLNRKHEKDLEKVLPNIGASLILVEKSLFEPVVHSGQLKNVALIESENPKKDLIDALNNFFPQNNLSPFIDSTALIHHSVKLGNNLQIGPYVVIEEDVSIGNGSEIEANAIIKKGTVIGCNVRIKSCSVIGGSGFGYDKSSNENSYQFLPHFGKVIIEDDVDIGSNTCIDRGSLSDTIIRKGVKIDNLVHIAHNVDIGENTLVIACSMVAGSVVIGENSWIAPSVSVRNGLKIGKNCTVGFGSVLTSDIDDGATVLGAPAIDIEDFKLLRIHQKSILASKKKN